MSLEMPPPLDPVPVPGAEAAEASRAADAVEWAADLGPRVSGPQSSVQRFEINGGAEGAEATPVSAGLSKGHAENQFVQKRVVS